MSSSQNDKKSSDAEMVEASSQAPESTPSDNTPSCVANFLSFREKMARRKAGKEPIHVCAEPPSSPAPVVTPVVDHVVQNSPGRALKEIILVLRAPVLIRLFQRGVGRGGVRRATMGSLRIRKGRSWRRDFVESECGSEVGRLARDMTEMQGKLFESEAMLKAIEDSHSAKVSKLEVQISELERDLGKTASSLLKEKKARKTKSLVARLTKISDFLGSLECIRSRDLALATIDGGMAVVQVLQGEMPSSLEAEEARLSACKGGRAAVDGSFDLILADQKSECFLPMRSEDPEGQDPAVGENGGGAAPSLDKAMGGGEPLLALNPCRSAGFNEWMKSLRLNVLRLYDLSGWNRASLQGQFLVYLGHWEFDVISNELGGRLYRLDLREKYVFEKMLMRMIVPFFLRPGFRLCDVWWEIVS
ncbi:hypothetical protein F2Q69_00005817 [Brassica cretica]|uniref:Uncharacterized protein n=1 Tax=Brassica cretica TaxID=69181 RepID=A0A8S9NZH6_BRACR|nr:hypothetical protein F2Q69_00005817 [Brassica cretica]